MSTTKLSLVLSAISSGEFDEHLDRIFQCARDRKRETQRTASALTLARIKPGDTVRLSPDTRPSYLAGCTATVVEIHNNAVTVEGLPGRFAGRTRIPASLVEVIE